MRRHLAASVATGLLFGLGVRLGDAGTGVVPWLVNVGGPWVVVAFVVGWTAASGPARAGVACLIAAVCAKYGLQVAQGAIDAGALVRRLVAWGVAAIVVGVVFGGGGAAARRGAWRPWALAGAVLAAEAAAFLTGVLHGESAELRYDGQPAATWVFAGELALGAACVVVAWAVARRGSRGPRPRAPA